MPGRCGSDAGKFLDYARTLFEHQPPEGGPGLTNAELIELGATVDLTDPAFGSCVTAGRYPGWPPYVTDVAVARGVAVTPTVLVDGVAVAPDARAVAAAAGVTGRPGACGGS